MLIVQDQVWNRVTAVSYTHLDVYKRQERIKRRKAQGLQDRYLYDYTFANDNGQSPLMDNAG